MDNKTGIPEERPTSPLFKHAGSKGKPQSESPRRPHTRPHPQMSQFRPLDRVAAKATVEAVVERDDRVFVTARFEGNPSPIVLDSIWTNCAVCDLSVGGEVRLAGQLKRINHGGASHWDTASILFDGTNHAVALPLVAVEQL